MPAASGKAATDEVSYSGDTAVVQLVRNVAVTGSEGSKTVVENMPASLGAKTSAESFPVTLSSDEAELSVIIGGGSAVTVKLVDAGGDALPVDTTSGVKVNLGADNDVTVASLPLPAGAATAAKQPALGTAGTSSADVLTVQGRASMTPVLVDGSATTQPISGTVTANVGTGTQPVSGTVTANIGTGTLAAVTAITNVVHVDDNAGSLTVDGTFWQATQPVSGTVAVTGVATETSVAAAATSLAALDDLVIAEDAAHANGDKGIVALAVRRDTATSSTVTDGDYGTLTTDTAGRLRTSSADTTQPVSGTFWQATQPVSGTVTANAGTGTLAVSIATAPALVASSANIGDVDVLTIAAGDNNIGNVDIVTMPNVTIGTMAALVTGSAAIGKLAANSGVDIGDVDVTSLPASTNTLEVVGDVAQDAAIAGNPLAVGFRASTAIPTAMSADGDVVYPWANRSGAPVVAIAPHVGLNSDPFNLQSKTAQYTTTQTSAVLQAGGASEKVVVTKVQIQVGGTTAGTMQLYFGTGAYSRGTNRAIFDGEFAPSATLKPGVVMDGPFVSGTNGDDVLVTTSAAINPLTVTIWFYLVS